MYHPELSEIALFGTDVATDWINGYNLITEEHIIWGTVMCVLPLAPVGIVGPVVAFAKLECKYGKFCAIFIILLLYVPAVVIATPCYIGFVLLTSVMKLWNPKLEEVNGNVLFGVTWRDVALMRIAEIVTESCPQSMLGKFSIVRLQLCISVKISKILF